MTRRLPLFVLPLAAALAVGPGPVSADSAEVSVSAPQARLVEVFPRVRQALLFDKNRDEYVVVKSGDRFQSFAVAAIEADQIVLRSQRRPGAHFVLPLAPKSRPAPPSGSSGAAGGRLRILDPYVGARGESDLDVVDPYKEDADIPEVTAPPGSRAGRTDSGSGRAEPEPESKPEPKPKPKPTATAKTEADEPGKKNKKKGASPRVEKPREERRTIRRAELDKALSDFHALRKEVEIERTEEGHLRLTGLARGSFLHRIGLREGDVIRSVAGRRIDNADRAAAVYVELTVADRFDVSLVRGGSSRTIRYRVR